jgi:hypothetical protein
MKNSLSSKGLSMSQAASISNLCNQRAQEISSRLDNINNVSKELAIGGEIYIETQGNPIPENVVQLLQAKARLSATQAFLMENIKAKDELINKIKYEGFQYDVEAPIRPQTISENHELVGSIIQIVTLIFIAGQLIFIGNIIFGLIRRYKLI